MSGGTGRLTDAQRAELRAILADGFRGTLRYGEPLILDSFIRSVRVQHPAAIEFDFLPDPAAARAAEPEPVPIVIPIPPETDPARLFVGLLMANPSLAATVFEHLRSELEVKMLSGVGHDDGEVRIADAIARCTAHRRNPPG